jgi:hypothetical protein
MARRARRRTGRGAEPIARRQAADTEGAERYMWAFPEKEEIILSIPGLRDLRLTIPEAKEIGEMLIEIADDTLRRQNKATTQEEVGD